MAIVGVGISGRYLGKKGMEYFLTQKEYKVIYEYMIYDYDYDYLHELIARFILGS